MASQQQQTRPMFRFASMLRPAGAPPPPAAATAAAPQPMFRPPVAAPSFRPPTATAPPPQTRDPSPPPRPPTAPAPAPAPAPPPLQPPPAAPATRSPVRTVLAPPPVIQPRFPVVAPPPAEPRPKSPATRTSAAIPVGVQLYQAPKPATSSRSPPPSPRNLELAMKAPNQYSPQVKPVSPLKLPPPAQFKSEAEVEPRIPAEIDQKTVVVQERAERNKGTAQKFNATQRYSTSEADWTGKREAMVTKDKDNIHHKKRSDTEDPFGMSVLTLAGENKGAMMELSPARANKHGFNGNPRRLQESDGEKSGKESEEEGKSRMGEKNNNPKGMESLPMTAFMNSNVQGVNNSILHNASCTHHDPGVHLIFSRKGGRYTKEAHRLKD